MVFVLRNTKVCVVCVCVCVSVNVCVLYVSCVCVFCLFVCIHVSWTTVKSEVLHEDTVYKPCRQSNMRHIANSLECSHKTYINHNMIIKTKDWNIREVILGNKITVKQQRKTRAKNTLFIPCSYFFSSGPVFALCMYITHVLGT